MLDACAIRGSDHHCNIVACGILDQFSRMRFCQCQAAWYLIGGLHAGRMIDDIDPTFAGAIHPAPTGSYASEHQECNEEELQVEQ